MNKECQHQCSGNCRRVGCNCLCGEYHTQPESNWVERFDEKYPAIVGHRLVEGRDGLKKFIRIEIEATEERVRKIFEDDFSRGYGEGIKQGKLDVLKEIEEKLSEEIPALPTDQYFVAGSNAFRQFVLDLLTGMRKEI